MKWPGEELVVGSERLGNEMDLLRILGLSYGLEVEINIPTKFFHDAYLIYCL